MRVTPSQTAIRDRRATGQGKNVIAFEDVSAMALVDLLDEDARIAVVDVHCDMHLIERQNRRVWPLLAEGNDDTGVTAAPRGGEKKKEYH
jgi:hypothetical protein